MLHADTPKIETLPRQAQLWSHGARMNGAAKPTVNGYACISHFSSAFQKQRPREKTFPKSPGSLC